jgi:hypothetical protein
MRTTSIQQTLSAAEREWIRRQGRVSRAIEAAQRRSTGRFTRLATPAVTPSARTSGSRR